MSYRLPLTIVSLAAVFQVFLEICFAVEGSTSSIGVSYESYLTEIVDQNDSKSALFLNSSFVDELKWKSAEMDTLFKIDVTASMRQDQKLSFINVKELFGEMDGGSWQTTSGRRLFDWNALDERWHLGLWQPQFLWNPVTPQAQGQTGLFFSSKGANWNMTLFVSPIFIPHQYPPYFISEGKVSSYSRWTPLVPLPESALFSDQMLPIEYDVIEPSKESVVWQPSAAFKYSFLFADRRLFVSVSFASLLANDPRFHISDPYLKLSGGGQSVAVVIRPEFYRHHLLGLEGGWRANSFELILSGVFEDLPGPPSQETLYFHYQPLRAWGGELRWNGDLLTANFSLYKRSSGDPIITGPNQSLFVYPPLINSSTLFSNAIQVDLGLQPIRVVWLGSLFRSYGKAIYDLDAQATIFSARTSLEWSTLRWNVGLEVIGTAPSQAPVSFFTQAQSNDRAFTEVEYLF